MDSLLERFLRYVKIDTQSDETSPSYPSTAKQLDLCRVLEAECKELGLADVSLSEFGVVTATVPATVEHDAPAIVFVAHVDTSPEYTGTNVNPIVHESYSGGDITLPNDTSKVITLAENPELNDLHGCTIITTDGTTLLGSDDKSGIAVIMSAAAHLMAHPEIKHGPIRLCFTCDEEIGRGIDKVDIPGLKAVCGYTLDGSGQGVVDSETFSADGATIRVQGINTHPSIGKDKMVNAIRILAAFLDQLPKDTLAPEVTDGRDGFIHPYHIEGGVDKAQARIILRDFETSKLKEHAERLESIADSFRKQYPRATIEVEIKEQYRNMLDFLEKEPRALSKALEAIEAVGMKPVQSIIRGGTDGSILSERGLPTPNFSTGQHNQHSPLEWSCLEEMQKAVEVLVALTECWGKERI